MEEKMKKLVSELAACQAMCNYCFKSCLEEADVKMMVKCIKLDKECAEICGLALSLVASGSEFIKQILDLCAKACEKCGEECKKHHNEHCQECAKTCDACAKACRSYN